MQTRLVLAISAIIGALSVVTSPTHAQVRILAETFCEDSPTPHPIIHFYDDERLKADTILLEVIYAHEAVHVQQIQRQIAALAAWDGAIYPAPVTCPSLTWDGVLLDEVEAYYVGARLEARLRHIPETQTHVEALLTLWRYFNGHVDGGVVFRAWFLYQAVLPIPWRPWP